MTHADILKRVYLEASNNETFEKNKKNLSEDLRKQVETIASKAEGSKGVVAVLTTLLAHKIVNPRQDIRYHQSQQKNGFSGRTIDEKDVTPFLKSVKFPAMAESGWLTRSLEQPVPYDMSYPGKISPPCVKSAFLTIICEVQENNKNPEPVLVYLFGLLIREREKLKINLAKPHSLSISRIIQILEKHFSYKYDCSGASRLPVIAIYAAYQCMMNQVERYKSKSLCPIESHTSADKQSGRIGDIEIDNENGTPFEGIEVKHEIEITPQIVKDSFEKFKAFNTDRYYLLTTATMTDSGNWNLIEEQINKIKQIHGCQVIVNGVYSTLRYYLRLLKDPAEFIEKYVELLKEDSSVKYQHKEEWNNLISLS